MHSKPLTTSNKPSNIPLNTSEWGEFKIGELFNVLLAKGDIKIDELEKGPIPLVSSGENNNGVVGYISSDGDGKSRIFSKGMITLDMFGNAFYQERPFYAVSHGRVNILEPKHPLNKYVGLFVCCIIRQNQYKYSYGRAVYSGVAETSTIKLPITPSGDPDWNFMEYYIKSLPYGDKI